MNNNLLFNAALDGYIDGLFEGRSVPAAVPAAAVTEAVNFATEFDSLIANDGTISGGAGVTLAPSTAAIAGAQQGKVGAARAAARATASGRYATGISAGGQLTPATNAVALYTATIAGLVTG